MSILFTVLSIFRVYLSGWLFSHLFVGSLSPLSLIPGTLGEANLYARKRHKSHPLTLAPWYSTDWLINPLPAKTRLRSHFQARKTGAVTNPDPIYSGAFQP